MYFLHSYQDVGSKYLCEKDSKGTIILHGELDIIGQEWHPVTDCGEPYKPVRLVDHFGDPHTWYRFEISELNEEISEERFQKYLASVKDYID